MKLASDDSVLGTAYSVCTTDEPGADRDQVLCTVVLKFKSENQIALSTIVPVPHEGAKTETFDTVVTGGTFAYEGVTGTAHFVPRSDGG